MITKDMKVSDVLKKNPELLEVLANFDSHFELLRKPALRNTMARLVSIEKASQIAGVNLATLLHVLNSAIGEKDSASENKSAGSGSASAVETEEMIPMPEELRTLDETLVIRIDVRPDIGEGKDPFLKIMAATKSLKPGGVLIMKNTFQPFPLYDVLGKKGLSHWARKSGDSDYEIYFYRTRAGADVRSAPADSAAGEIGISGNVSGSATAGETDISRNVNGAATIYEQANAGVFTIDVRGLEPPQPMVKVMEKLAAIPPGATLVVTHEKRPVFLLEKLRDRGYKYEIDEQPGAVTVRIRKN